MKKYIISSLGFLSLFGVFYLLQVTYIYAQNVVPTGTVPQNPNANITYIVPGTEPPNQICPAAATTASLLSPTATLNIWSPTTGQIFKDGDSVTVNYSWQEVPLAGNFIARIGVPSIVSEAAEGNLLTRSISMINGNDTVSYQLPHDMVTGDYSLRVSIYSSNGTWCQLDKSVIFHVNSSIIPPPSIPKSKNEIPEPIADTYSYSDMNSIKEKINLVLSSLPALQQQVAMLNNFSSVEIKNGVQVQLSSMITILSNLQNALGTIRQSTVTIEPDFSYTWQRDLYYGSRNNEDVLALQKALTLEGVYDGPLTGNFFTLTRAGLLAFQRKQNFINISPNGYLGPLTRKVLNDTYSKP